MKLKNLLRSHTDVFCLPSVFIKQLSGAVATAVEFSENIGIKRLFRFS